MHRPARRSSARQFLNLVTTPKRKTPQLRRGALRKPSRCYLLVEQLLEIIFTLFTLNVEPDPEELAPVEAAELLGLEEEDAELLLSVPVRRI